MDVGLGSLGVLEGPRLDLYKIMPPGIRANVCRENLMFQLVSARNGNPPGVCLSY